MTREVNEKYMLRCLELAAKGLGKTKSNPLVGSVIVHDNKIIGEGYHREFGGPHAEVIAIHSVKQPQLLGNSTLYVNLEPCSHFGKTPPCVHLIKESGIPHVVIGTSDPNPLVAGKGIDFLKKNGIIVSVNHKEQECRFLNRRFFVAHNNKRPYIILKWARSADGFLDSRTPEDTGKSRSVITGKQSQILVHKWRSEEMAIMVGTNTANMDDPSLTVRYWTGDNPVRITVERNKTLNQDISLLNDNHPTVIYSTFKRENKLSVEYIFVEKESMTLGFILNDLWKRGIISLIVEGGAELLKCFLEINLWDEARIFKGPGLLKKGVKAPFPGNPGKKVMIDEDELDVIFNSK